MRLAQMQEMLKCQADAIFLKSCNEVLKGKMKEQTVPEVCKAEILALIAKNNLEIKALLKANHHFCEQVQ